MSERSSRRPSGNRRADIGCAEEPLRHPGAFTRSEGGLPAGSSTYCGNRRADVGSADGPHRHPVPPPGAKAGYRRAQAPIAGIVDRTSAQPTDITSSRRLTERASGAKRFGGGGGNRTRVRRTHNRSIYARSLHIRRFARWGVAEGSRPTSLAPEGSGRPSEPRTPFDLRSQRFVNRQ